MNLTSKDLTHDQYWSLLELSTSGAWYWKITTDEILWSPSLTATLWQEPGPRQLNDIMALTHPDDRAAHQAAIDNTLASNELYSLQTRLKASSGEYEMFMVRGICEHDATGRPTALLGFVVSTEASAQQLQALALSEQRLTSFMDNCPAAVYIKGADGRHLYANTAAAELAGVALDDMLGLTNQELFPADTAAVLDEIDLGVLDSRELRTWDGPLERKNQPSRQVHEIKFPIEMQPGEIALAGFGVDMTELFETQRTAEASQRLDSIGRLAGGIAHDFNNMLSVILGYSEAAAGELGDEHPVTGYLQEIIAAANRSATITHQLLGFARRQPTNPVTLNIAEHAQDTMGMLRRLIHEDIQIDLRAPEVVNSVKLDPGQFVQLLTNLCINARDAITGSGQIDIEINNVDISEAQCEHNPDLRVGHYVSLAVSDNGSGISPGTLEHMFEPFYTTKSSTQGTGLGLATVYGIVQQNDGFLSVDSSLGNGATITLYLPALLDQVVDTTTAAATTHVRGNGERVLLVEDEPALLNVMRHTLKRLGYKVVATTSPMEALQLAGDDINGFAALVSDIVMPELNGHELAAALRSLRPTLPVLLLSGYADPQAPGADSSIPIILKPVNTHTLSDELAALLHADRD